jgi:hypothetical protein
MARGTASVRGSVRVLAALVALLTDLNDLVPACGGVVLVRRAIVVTAGDETTQEYAQAERA